jgi:hypothetical protein
MNDAHQLALAMFALALAGVMLVTGQLYLEYQMARGPAAAISATIPLD